MFRLRYHAVVLSLLLAACSGGGGGGSAPPRQSAQNPQNPTPTVSYLFDDTTRSASPAEPDRAPPNLVSCSVGLTESQACTLAGLPLIGMETDNPTVDDVMARVVVTDDWMATRIRDFLGDMPPEILLLTRGVTAIVISSEVRPSFYWARTGAIYLDPDDLWLTADESQDTPSDPDPRLADIQKFKFTVRYRYVDSEGSIYASSRVRNRDVLEKRLAALLFHELAHANDFFPPTSMAQLDRTIAIYQNIDQSALGSTQLSNALPLTSDFMRDLASAAFNEDVSPTPAQLAVTATQVADEFPYDRANDYYNYSSPREDLAMLFEETMMLRTMGISRDVAVTEFPANTQYCDQLTVVWGQRGRLGESNIVAAAEMVVDHVLPEVAADTDAFLESLPLPQQMTPGVDWCSSVNFAPAASGASPRALTLTRRETVLDAGGLPRYR